MKLGFIIGSLKIGAKGKTCNLYYPEVFGTYV